MKVIITIIFISMAVRGGPLQTIPDMHLTVDKSDIVSFCGTDNVKIVFVRYNLWFVDFSEDTPQIRCINQAESVVAPVMSPEGDHIAFVNGIVSETPNLDNVGTVWTCEFNEDAIPESVATPAFSPRFVKNAEQPTLVFTTSNYRSSKDEYIWDGKGETLLYNLVTERIDTVHKDGSYSGGLSYDGRYLCTAEYSNNAFMLDLTAQSTTPSRLHRLYVKKETTDIDTFIDVEVCNPSISSSTIFTNVMMYFDLGSEVQIEPAGCYHPLLGEWECHQYIYLTRADNSILKVFDTPETQIASELRGEGEKVQSVWGFPEWSNHPYYAIASCKVTRLWLRDGRYESVPNNEVLYLINLKDSTYLKIMETNDTTYSNCANMLWPGAWIETPEDFQTQEDTAWLASPKIPADVNPSGNKRREATAFYIRGKRLFSNHKLSEVAIFTLSGRKIVSTKHINAHYYDIDISTCKSKNIRIIKAKTLGGDEAVLLNFPFQ